MRGFLWIPVVLAAAVAGGLLTVALRREGGPGSRSRGRPGPRRPHKRHRSDRARRLEGVLPARAEPHPPRAGDQPGRALGRLRGQQGLRAVPPGRLRGLARLVPQPDALRRPRAHGHRRLQRRHEVRRPHVQVGRAAAARRRGLRDGHHREPDGDGRRTPTGAGRPPAPRAGSRCSTRSATAGTSPTSRGTRRAATGCCPSTGTTSSTAGSGTGGGRTSRPAPTATSPASRPWTRSCRAASRPR